MKKENLSKGIAMKVFSSYLCGAKEKKRKKKMETITLTFNPNMPYAASIEAFLKTLPEDVKVSKDFGRREARPSRKRRSNYQITVDTVHEAREGKNVNRYNSADELFEKLGI